MCRWFVEAGDDLHGDDRGEEPRSSPLDGGRAFFTNAGFAQVSSDRRAGAQLDALLASMAADGGSWLWAMAASTSRIRWCCNLAVALGLGILDDPEGPGRSASLVHRRGSCRPGA